MERVKYITFVGRSSWAVVNSFSAVLFHTEIIPDEIHVLYKREDEEVAEVGISGLYELMDVKEIGCELVQHVIEEDFDLLKPARVVEEIMESDGDVVIDITPAKKFMSSTALLEGRKYGVDGVFYLYIDHVEDADRPYLDIPLPRQDLIEMVEGEHYVRD